MIGLAMMLAAQDPVVITVSGPPCTVALDGKRTPMDDIAMEAKRLKARRRGIVVRYDQASDQCLGGVLYQLQRFKLERVRFEPPLPSEGWTVQ